MNKNIYLDPLCPVSVAKCDEYNREIIKNILKTQFLSLKIEGENYFKGKKIVIKPNLVMKKSPEAAATTNPVTLEAVILLLNEFGATDIVIAESPGGPYTESSLRAVYRACGIEEVVQNSKVTLNYDTSFNEVRYQDGTVSKFFNMIQPIIEADVIINLCKLKTHSLTMMSCAVKNLFGVIPGVQKFEMHARFPELTRFSAMLVDLCKCVCQNHEVIHIADGIIGMEGNGPTSGNPRKIGAIFVSRNPYNLDLAAADLIGIASAPMIECAKERKFCPELPEKLIFTELEKLHLPSKINNFVMPDASSSYVKKKFFVKLPTIMGGKFAKFFEPHPNIMNNICIGCGDCVNSCPVNTINFIKVRGKRKAKIDISKCITCFCCQELCPYKAVKVVKNPIISFLR